MASITTIGQKIGIKLPYQPTDSTTLKEALSEKNLFQAGNVTKDTLKKLDKDEQALLQKLLGGNSNSADQNTLLVKNPSVPLVWIQFIEKLKNPKVKMKELCFDNVPAGFFATNPGKPIKLDDGRIIMPVREQQDPAQCPPGMPKPGPSQIGLYEVRSGNNFDEIQCERIETLLTSDTTWFEDPSLIKIDGKLVLGAVKVEFEDRGENFCMTNFATHFYQLDEKTLSIGNELAVGPDRMKDLRVFPLKNGKLAVLTRPKDNTAGGDYGNGYIGFTQLNSLADLNSETVLAAKPLLIPKDIIKAIPTLGAFRKGVWVGANDCKANSDNTVTVYGHFGTEGPYGSFCFTFDPDHFEDSIKDIQLLALSKDFPTVPGGPIRPDTVFSGGVIENKDKTLLTVGLNDYRAGLLEISS